VPTGATPGRAIRGAGYAGGTVQTGAQAYEHGMR
jgi:hypothetical protein